MPRKLRFVIGVAVMVAAVAYLIFTAVRNTSEYYLTVDEVRSRQAELSGQLIRVAGRVETGPIQWNPQSLTLGFDLVPLPPDATQPSVKPVAATASAAIFHVIARGQPKPDMFAPGRDVIVEGRLTANNTIEARQVLTSCPSKYVPKKPA